MRRKKCVSGLGIHQVLGQRINVIGAVRGSSLVIQHSPSAYCVPLTVIDAEETSVGKV